MGQMVQDPPRRTLAARLADRDRRRFTGRVSELAFLDKCLDDDDAPASVVHVSGPGGIGKSTLLRELARRAAARDRRCIAVDGRQLGPAPGMLEAAMREAAQQARPVVLLDSYERMTALDPYLRRELVPGLPDQALVVIAGRATPDPAWFSGGWEAVTARLDLGALAPADAQRLLAAHGLSDERVPGIIEWAAGSPLALALAADAATTDASWNAARTPDRPDLVKSLLHRLVETELRDIRPSALGIAVVARSTTPQLLRAVLRDADADAEYRQLSELTVSEPVGDGITLHELARKVLLADLRLRNPELERDLRRRIIDYLYARALGGEPLLVIDMAHLLENPLLRWGFGWHGNVSYRIDSVRPGDADAVELLIAGRQNVQWWQLTRRYFTAAPERAAVARDRSDRICGYMVCMSPATAPRFADSDPLIGPWLAHARQNRTQGESVLWQAAVDLTGQGQVQAMLGIAGVLRSGVSNPRFTYLPIDPAYPGAVDFARALGAAHLTDLDARIGSQSVQCHQMDYGVGGLFTRLRAQVYRELGLPAPHAESGPPSPAEPAPVPVSAPVVGPGSRSAPTAASTLMPAGPSAADPVPVALVDAVRDALRNFRVPRELARSPLARGATVQERAESVRLMLRAAADEAFGDSETENLLHSVLLAGYIEPLRSHEAAATALCLSRAAYFRRLRTAVSRVAEHLAMAQQASALADRRETFPGYR
jgi:hypothetical protein